MSRWTKFFDLLFGVKDYSIQSNYGFKTINHFLEPISELLPMN